MALQLYDYAGNPMAAGVKVNIYPHGAPQTAANLIASDWTTAGGLCPNLSLDTAVNYVATFIGRQGPVGAQAFAGGVLDPTAVVVANYQSPSLLTAAYAALQTQTLWPRGNAWWSDDARRPGGVAYALAYGIGAIFSSVDANAQNQLQAARVQSSQDGDVDSWVQDFLGMWLPRYTGESNVSYKSRAYAALQMPKTTLAALTNVVSTFYTVTALDTAAADSQAMGFDNGPWGFDTGSGAFDLSSAYTALIPTITVWDRQSRPDLANLYGINPNNNDGSFVIQLGFSPPSEDAWYLDYSSVDFDSFLIDVGEFDQSTTAPDPRLGALVNFTKAAGAKPLYLTAIITP